MPYPQYEYTVLVRYKKEILRITCNARDWTELTDIIHRQYRDSIIVECERIGIPK